MPRVVGNMTHAARDSRARSAPHPQCPSVRPSEWCAACGVWGSVAWGGNAGARGRFPNGLLNRPAYLAATCTVLRSTDAEAAMRNALVTPRPKTDSRFRRACRLSSGAFVASRPSSTSSGLSAIRSLFPALHEARHSHTNPRAESLQYGECSNYVGLYPVAGELTAELCLREYIPCGQYLLRRSQQHHGLALSCSALTRQMVRCSPYD